VGLDSDRCPGDSPGGRRDKHTIQEIIVHSRPG
jgi:hypothetical protein